MMAHVSAVRALYKRILVLHRFLPLDLKALGDQYVKDEFRRHRGAEPGEAGSFMEEWKNYRDTLQTQVLEAQLGPARFGVDLTEERLPDFQDQQIGQLYELLLEASKPNRQFNIQDD